MFKHILFPTDGGAPSLEAMVTCAQLARSVGARLTVLHVCAPLHFLSVRPGLLTDAESVYSAHRQCVASTCVEQVAAIAGTEGMTCTTLVVEHESPWRAIVDTARVHRCDLVVMASHGLGGWRALFIGSETHAVLAHSDVPVMVLRQAAHARSLD